MEEATLPSHSSIHLVSRLDHLEFIMKYLERKLRGGSNDCCTEKQSMPLDLAVKDPYFKGSLLDRVASLEHRLFQLCLETDSSSSSYLLSHASTQTSGESSSSQSTNTQIFYSFPTFSTREDKAMSHTHIDPLHHLQEDTGREQHQTKDERLPKQEEVKNKEEKRNEKKSKSGKKRVSPNWPHFKLLGC